jgi:SAM-dependent methyltransferase
MRALLSLKEVNQYHLDDPQRTLLHRDIILSKRFLKKLYLEWYGVFTRAAKDLPNGEIVELGSGGGFLKEVLPQVITSDILPLPNCDRCFSALNMPFANETLGGIFMIDVFHHIPDSKQFLLEAQRVLKPGGKIIMIEPANSIWGRFIYQNFHHEPFDPTAGWFIPESGPMSGANGALPWIVFERDQVTFKKEFESLTITSIRYHTPLRYLLSGGVSRKALVPAWAFGFFKGIEERINPLTKQFSMFQTIEVTKA